MAALAAPLVGGVAPAQEPGEGVLEEVLITAQHRKEDLQKVPIAVTALTRATLEETGVGDITEVLGLVPGVYIETAGTTNQSNIFIRGVGTSLLDGGVEHSIGLYVDGVYQGGQQAFNTSLFDLESVEVLRGPQGTLYGKNALGGAIKLTTVKPQGEFSSYLEGNIGNYGLRELRAMVNGPLGAGKLLARLTGVHKERDGIIRNTWPGSLEEFGTLDGYGARLQLRVLPTDAVTLDFAADFSHDEPVIGSGNFPGVVQTRTTSNATNGIEDRDIRSFSGELSVQLAAATFTAISAYKSWDIDTVVAGDLANALYSTEQDIDFRQFSQELRLASLDERRLRWLVGAFFYDESSTLDVPFELVQLAAAFGYPPGYSERSFADLESQSYAAFADLTYDLTDALTASVGLRYSREEKSIAYSHGSNWPDADFQALIDAVFGPGSGLTPDMFRFAPLFSTDEERDYDDASPRFVLSNRFSGDLMAYLSASRGYKAGGFNASFVPTPSELFFDPEKAWSYELGAKSTWLDGRLRVNAAAYYVDWEDQQARAFLPFGPGFTLLIANAPETVSQGADLEISVQPTAGLLLSAGYSYIDAEFEDFSNAPGGDATGKRLPFIARDNINASVSWRKPIGAALHGLVRLDYQHRSRAFVDNDNTAAFETPERDLVDARIGLEGDRWEVSLWGKNLFDDKYFTFASPGIVGFDGRIGEPRTYGVRFVLRH
jgi:iron complex outermembrane receptor protein